MLALDHLVYAVPHFADGVAQMNKRLGVTATPGGQHLGLGTRNALVNIGNGAYLEIVGPDPEQPPPENGYFFNVDRLAQAGLVAWAVKTSDISATVEQAKRLGYDCGSIIDMSRQKPDGTLLKWRLTLPTMSMPILPFFIDWLDTPHPTTSLTHNCQLVNLGLGRVQLNSDGQDITLSMADYGA